MAEDRKFAVESAGFWFTSARKAQADGKMRDALICMENAFNHTENALFSVRKRFEEYAQANLEE